MDEENKSQKQLIEEAAERESGLQREIKSLLRKIDDIESKVSILFCLFCYFTSQVNSYGYGGMVSSPNYTFFPGQA